MPEAKKSTSKKVAGEKSPVEKTGLVSTMKQAAKALKERYAQVVRVIDEALASENLKDRIWAVEQILKRVKPEDEAPKPRVKKQDGAGPDPATLTDEELLARIEAYLYDAPCN